MTEPTDDAALRAADEEARRRNAELDLEDEDDDAPESDFKPGLAQKLLSPMYLLILCAFIATATVPVLIVITVAWMAFDAGSR